MRYTKVVRVALALLLLAWSNVFAAVLWYEDNNLGRSGGMPRDFVEKFLHPESWAGAREKIDTYMLRANWLTQDSPQINDDFLKNHFLPVLNSAGIKLALNVGGATWKSYGNRDQKLNKEVAVIDRITRLGGKVSYLSLQSVLSKTLHDEGQAVEYGLDQRIADCVDYALTIKRHYPEIRIGIIDALPSKGKDYQRPYAQLAKAFRDNGLTLDHVILDLPYELVKEHKKGLTWGKIKRVEQYVKTDLGSRFGIISTSRQAGLKSNREYHHAVLAMWQNYTQADGDPDFFLLASWFPHPDKSIPENAVGDDYPAMRTVNDFARNIQARERQRASPAWQENQSREAVGQ